MLLTPLQSLLNRNIAASGAALSLCRRLEGRTLALEVEAVPVKIFFQSRGDRLEVTSKFDGLPSATLTGTPLALIRLAGSQPEAAFRGGAVRIQGDAEVAQTFSELLKYGRPEFEEELSRLVGDVAAHQIGNATRSLFGFVRNAADTLAQNVSEYLREEGRDVPTRTEAEEFISAVDKLRDDVERVEARIARLERSRKRLEGRES